MARSCDFGWAGSGIWARGEGLETSKKVILGREGFETEDDGKSSLRKVAGALGRPFGGSGLSKYSFRY